MTKATFLLAAAAAAFVGATGAAPAQSVAVTPLKSASCKGAPGNAEARRDEHGHVVYDCKGAAGWRVRLVYRGATTIAEFTPRGAAQKSFTLYSVYDIGPRIEWRSAATGAAPYAAIVRLHNRTGAHRVQSALAVLGVNGAGMCLAAIVSPAAKPGQNAAARQAADALKDSGRCDPVQTIGPETETTREFVDRNR